MGTDSRDLFVELSYDIPENRVRLSLDFDQLTHNIAGPAREISKTYTLRARFPFSNNMEITVMGGYGRITNPGNVSGAALYVNEVSSEIRYVF